MASHQSRLDQRTNIRFMVARGSKPIEIWRALRETFGDRSLSKTQVCMWCNRFSAKDQTTPVKDRARSGRPRKRAAHVEEIRRLVQEDGRVTISDLASKTGLHVSSVQRVLKVDLKMSKLCAKFMPHQLTPEQAKFWKDLCEMNLREYRHDDKFLERIVTGDETWVPLFDPESKQDSSQWLPKGSARPTKAVKSRAQKKTMLIFFYDMKGVVHLEFLPQGETVETDLYCQILSRLKENVRRKRPNLWKYDSEYHTMRLHHDNASCHTSAKTLAVIGESDILMVSHPPYSPDLAPCDYWAFPFIKNHLRGHKFRNLEEVQAAVRRVFRETSPDQFKSSIQDLPSRWMKCVQNDGQYFEGQNVQIPDHLSVTESEDSSQESSDNE